jgi:hypothetical protein
MSSWTKLLEQAEPEDHVAQLYGDDDQTLTKNVSRYLAEGLRRLDGAIVIATPEHAEAIARHLAEEAAGIIPEAEREGRLIYRDARATLDSIMVDGRPEQASFDRIIAGALGEVRRRSRSGRVRAFGEMVNLLWSEGRQEAATLLEGHWNAILATCGASLYCAYRIDLFRHQVDRAGLNSIVAAHTHLFAGPRTILSSGRAAR